MPAVARPRIEPRSAWAAGLAPQGRLSVEKPGDVRFLLVHHSQTPPDSRADIPGRLAGMYRYHTSSKGWPDIAYNFLVDPYGRIWEGRAGSLTRPVMGDATGGSQGFALLCCFIGDHTTQPPTSAAMRSMTQLLAWLADTYRIDLDAGRAIRFVSRGSTKWPRGRRVVTEPIAAHRDMSATECPGDALYPLVRTALLPHAGAIVRAARLPASTPSPASPSPGSGTASASSPPSSALASGDGSGAAWTSSAQGSGPPVSALARPDGDSAQGAPLGVVGAAGALAIGGIAWVIARRMGHAEAPGRHARRL